MHSPEIEKLPPSAFKLFLYMLDRADGKKEFTFPHKCYAGLMDKKTFQKAREELEKVGLIKTVARNANLRKPAQYEFCLKWKQA